MATIAQRLSALEARVRALELKPPGDSVWIVPRIQIVSAPPPLTNNRSATFTLKRAAGEETAALTVSLDGGVQQAIGGNSWSCNGLNDGEHRVRFWIGAEDDYQAQYRWRVEGN
jgi:hypothetical protein